MKVYIAGPMSGLPQSNYPTFYKAAGVLRAKGLEVKNPADTPEQPNWEAYMRKGIIMMMTCEEVYLLPGWEASKGAVIEQSIAKAVGMPVHYPHEWCEGFVDPWLSSAQ